MIKVEIEIDQYGTKNWQWFVKRIPLNIVTKINDYQAIRNYFKCYGYDVRGVKFL